MPRFRYALPLLLLVLPGCDAFFSAVQPDTRVRISGLATDAASGEPVSSATVTVRAAVGLVLQTVTVAGTDEDGRYALDVEARDLRCVDDQGQPELFLYVDAPGYARSANVTLECESDFEVDADVDVALWPE